MHRNDDWCNRCVFTTGIHYIEWLCGGFYLLNHFFSSLSPLSTGMKDRPIRYLEQPAFCILQWWKEDHFYRTEIKTRGQQYWHFDNETCSNTGDVWITNDHTAKNAKRRKQGHPLMLWQMLAPGSGRSDASIPTVVRIVIISSRVTSHSRCPRQHNHHRSGI